MREPGAQQLGLDGQAHRTFVQTGEKSLGVTEYGVEHGVTVS